MHQIDYPELQKKLGSAPPWIMAVLNCTPDSFSDGGSHLTPEALAQFSNDTEDAHGIDIGGESTAPGRSPITSEEEVLRIRAALELFATDRFVSIDTFKHQTARWALERGASMINDVSALRADPELLAVVRDHQAFICLMFSKQQGEHPHATSEPAEYKDVLSSIEDFFSERIDFALDGGISQEKIILDPGMGGFISPNPHYSWEVLERFSELKDKFKTFPFLIGTSRKGFLGGMVSARDPISQLTALAASRKGASIIRTHNPKMMSQFIEAAERCRL